MLIDQDKAVRIGAREDAAAQLRRLRARITALEAENETLRGMASLAQDSADTATMALEDAERHAEHDGLTGLPTRALLLDRMRAALALSRRHGTRFAVLFLDLDGFKYVNDSLGHAAGDEVLRRIAQRLSQAVRAVDTVSRHGGDEFVVLLTDVTAAHAPAAVAPKLLAAIDAPIDVGDAAVRVRASIGISLFPDDGDDPHSLIDRADQAMYAAKRSGRGRFMFWRDAPAT